MSWHEIESRVRELERVRYDHEHKIGQLERVRYENECRISEQAATISDQSATIIAQQRRIEEINEAVLTLGGIVSEVSSQSTQLDEAIRSYVFQVTLRYDKRLDEMRAQIPASDGDLQQPRDRLLDLTEMAQLRDRLLDAERRISELEAERGAEMVH